MKLFSRHARLCSSLFLLLIVNSVFAMPVAQILTNSGQPNETVQGGPGNNILVYTPSLNVGTEDLYDGGPGLNTLWLRMTEPEFESPTFMTDLIRFYEQIILDGGVKSEIGLGHVYQFQSFNLRVRNIENIVIERINPRTVAAPAIIPGKTIPILNSDDDSLV